MGRKKKVYTATPTPASDAAAGGPSKYQTVKRLIESMPDISRTDIVSRLKAEGIDISVDMASSYASKARSELKGAGSSGGKKRVGRPRKVVVGGGTAAASAKPAGGSAAGVDDMIALAGLVKKLGAGNIKRYLDVVS